MIRFTMKGEKERLTMLFGQQFQCFYCFFFLVGGMAKTFTVIFSDTFFHWVNPGKKETHQILPLNQNREHDIAEMENGQSLC